jgi:hypothetical protein
MIEAGVLTEDDPVELLEGALVFKMPKKPKHRVALAKLQRALASVLPDGFSLQLQEPVTLLDGEPEPDAAVIRGRAEDYPDRHPGPADTPLIIEVADASLLRDRGIKLRSYARSQIAIYWIVNLLDRTIEVHRRPTGPASQPGYDQVEVFKEGDSVPVELMGNAVTTLAVAAVLP